MRRLSNHSIIYNWLIFFVALCKTLHPIIGRFRMFLFFLTSFLSFNFFLNEGREIYILFKITDDFVSLTTRDIDTLSLAILQTIV